MVAVGEGVALGQEAGLVLLAVSLGLALVGGLLIAGERRGVLSERFLGKARGPARIASYLLLAGVCYVVGYSIWFVATNEGFNSRTRSLIFVPIYIGVLLTPFLLAAGTLWWFSRSDRQARVDEGVEPPRPKGTRRWGVPEVLMVAVSLLAALFLGAVAAWVLGIGLRLVLRAMELHWEGSSYLLALGTLGAAMAVFFFRRIDDLRH